MIYKSLKIILIAHVVVNSTISLSMDQIKDEKLLDLYLNCTAFSLLVPASHQGFGSHYKIENRIHFGFRSYNNPNGLHYDNMITIGQTNKANAEKVRNLNAIIKSNEINYFLNTMQNAFKKEHGNDISLDICIKKNLQYCLFNLVSRLIHRGCWQISPKIKKNCKQFNPFPDTQQLCNVAKVANDCIQLGEKQEITPQDDGSKLKQSQADYADSIYYYFLNPVRESNYITDKDKEKIFNQLSTNTQCFHPHDCNGSDNIGDKTIKQLFAEPVIKIKPKYNSDFQRIKKNTREEKMKKKKINLTHPVSFVPFEITPK